MKNFNFINIIDILKFTISLALYLKCATNYLIFSANVSKYSSTIVNTSVEMFRCLHLLRSKHVNKS